MFICKISRAKKKENVDPRVQDTVAMIELPLYALCESESQCNSLFHSEALLDYEIGGNYGPSQPTGSNTKQPYLCSVLPEVADKVLPCVRIKGGIGCNSLFILQTAALNCASSCHTSCPHQPVRAIENREIGESNLISVSRSDCWETIEGGIDGIVAHPDFEISSVVQVLPL
jgi:hypothetical protein